MEGRRDLVRTMISDTFTLQFHMSLQLKINFPNGTEFQLCFCQAFNFIWKIGDINVMRIPSVTVSYAVKGGVVSVLYRLLFNGKMFTGNFLQAIRTLIVYQLYAASFQDPE